MPGFDVHSLHWLGSEPYVVRGGQIRPGGGQFSWDVAATSPANVLGMSWLGMAVGCALALNADDDF
jgi:hypothetical protein